MKQSKSLLTKFSKHICLSARILGTFPARQALNKLELFIRHEKYKDYSRINTNYNNASKGHFFTLLLMNDLNLFFFGIRFLEPPNFCHNPLPAYFMIDMESSDQIGLKPRPPQPPPPPIRKNSIETVVETCSPSEASPASRKAGEEDFPGYVDSYSHAYDIDEAKDPRDSRDSREESDNDAEEENALDVTDVTHTADATEGEKEVQSSPIERESTFSLNPALKDYESDGEYDDEDESSSSQPFMPPCPPPSTIPSPNMTSRPSASNLNNMSDVDIVPLQAPRPKKGMMDRQSLGIFINWKTRYFHLEHGRIIYFEPVHWFQEGEYETAGMKIVADSAFGDAHNVIRLQSFKYPDTCFRCKTADSKRRWVLALLAHIKYANDLIVQKKQIEQLNRSRSVSIFRQPSVSRKGSLAALADAEVAVAAPSPVMVAPAPMPSLCTGWIRKRGQFFPTIRRRFFVLQEGVISYYRVEWNPLEDNAISTAVKAVKPPRALGKFPVTHYDLFSDSTEGRIELTLMPGIGSISRRRLVLYLEDYMERDKWARAINAHAAYIK